MARDFVDCRGNVHPDEDSMMEANHDIVREIVDGVDEWLTEYVESGDYGDGYVYLACECSHDWPDRVSDWIERHYNWNIDKRTLAALTELLAEKVDEYELEAHYYSNEYACWGGDGCCVYSFPIGAEEFQVDLSRFPELVDLHASGDLNDALAAYRGDAYVYERDHYDKELGRRVSDGAVQPGDTYFTIIGSVGGAWHYVVPEETMQRLLAESIVEFCRKNDASA